MGLARRVQWYWGMSTTHNVDFVALAGILVVRTAETEAVLSITGATLVTVELPVWLSGDEYLASAQRWNSLWAEDGAAGWPESWQRAMLSPTIRHKGAVCALLCDASPKTDFEQSLRSQVISWIDGSRKYDFPLSYRQGESLTELRLRRFRRKALTL